MRAITITVPGRLRSHKNNYRVTKRTVTEYDEDIGEIVETTKGRLIRNAQLKADIETVQWYARQALIDADGFPLDHQVPFRVTIQVYVSGLNSADLDGIQTLVLDALEGEQFCYPNDKYAMECQVKRHLSDDERVEITVEELDRQVLEKASA